MIDDLSPQFNDTKEERFNSVDLFIDDARTKKYFALIDDVRFTDEKQLSIITIVRDHNGIAYLNEYGDIPTFDNLGTFEFNILGSEGQLLFYPTKYQFNDYNVSLISYNITDSTAGIGSTSFEILLISLVALWLLLLATAATTIAGIASTYRASKLLVQYCATDNSYFEFDELTVIHDGTTADLLEYGQIVSESGGASPGIGTYNAYLSGSNVNIDITPNVALASTFTVNTIRVSIADTSSVVLELIQWILHDWTIK